MVESRCFSQFVPFSRHPPLQKIMVAGNTPPPPPSKVCQNRKQKRKGHPNGQARDLWKTLIDLRPACA